MKRSEHLARIGSLFSGYGGLDMAVESVFKATTAWVADNAPGPAKILAHRAPGIPNLGDITTVDWSAVEPVDIITGGSPCQDLSIAGRRAGMTDGTRSNLWVQMREAITYVRPRFVVWENVRGACSAHANSDLGWTEGLLDARTADQLPKKEDRALRALGRVLGDLADLGYDAIWYGLRAADVGAPHGRFRIFLLAQPADADQAGAAQAGRHGHAESSAERPDLTLLPTPRATDGTKGGPNQRGSKGDLMLPSAVQQLLPTPVSSDTNGAGAHGDGGPDLRTTVSLLPTPTAATRDRSPEEIERRHGPGGERGSRGRNLDDVNRWGDYGPAIARWEALTRPAPAPTEPGAKGSPRLSPRFVEWMMGLPDGWVTDVPGITRNEALKALGNGVVPPQATHALTQLLSFERLTS